MQIQVCMFRRKPGGSEEVGLAKVRFGFGCHDVEWIVDSQGKKVGSGLWTYSLFDSPMCYIDTVTYAGLKTNEEKEETKAG